MVLTIQALRGFVAVVEERGFTPAARRLGLTQPAVSAQVRTLEEHFGEVLLERAGRTWRPTPAGEALYAHAAEIVRGAESMEDAVRSPGSSPAGRVAVCASTVPGDFLLPVLLGEFCARHPGIRVSVQVADTAQVAEDLLARRADIGFVGAPVGKGRLDISPFADDELLLVAPPGHPLAGRASIPPSELPRHPFVLRERGSGTRAVLDDALSGAGVDPGDLDVVVELGSTEAVKRAVQAGAGISFISCYALDAGDVPDRLAVVRVARLNTRRPLFLARESTRATRPATKALADYMTSRDIVGKLRRWRTAWRTP